MNHVPSHAPVVGYAVLTKVWLALVLLTLLLVTVSLRWGGATAIIAMLLVTPTKASLVAYFFMDLRHEGNLLRNIVFVTLGALVVFIGLLFADYFYR